MAFCFALCLAATGLPRAASAGFFDFLFGNFNRPTPAATPQYDSPADPSASSPSRSLPPFGDAADAGGVYAHCVRLCDGRYFPVLARTSTSPTQLCQAFCPASATRVFFGSNIDGAMAANGERYSETENAYAYRKALSPNCTCNGRDPAGLAPVDLSLDTTLRPSDVVATATGLLAYSDRTGGEAAFTPIGDYQGLAAAVRAKLGALKVAPVVAEPAAQADAMTTASISTKPRRRAITPPQ